MYNSNCIKQREIYDTCLFFFYVYHIGQAGIAITIARANEVRHFKQVRYFANHSIIIYILITQL